MVNKDSEYSKYSEISQTNLNKYHKCSFEVITFVDQLIYQWYSRLTKSTLPNHFTYIIPSACELGGDYNGISRQYSVVGGWLGVRRLRQWTVVSDNRIVGTRLGRILQFAPIVQRARNFPVQHVVRPRLPSDRPWEPHLASIVFIDALQACREDGIVAYEDAWGPDGDVSNHRVVRLFVVNLWWRTFTIETAAKKIRDQTVPIW